ncbi:unnamed protein product [Musa acuminata var. zebrina]
MMLFRIASMSRCNICILKVAPLRSLIIGHDGNKSAKLKPPAASSVCITIRMNSFWYLHLLPMTDREPMSLANSTNFLLRFTVEPALDNRTIDRTRLSTSSSRIKRKDWTRLALNSSTMLILRSSLQWNPYEVKPTPLSPYVADWRFRLVGREAKLTSWVFMISAAASVDETTRVGTSPSFRSITGPNF